LSNILSALAVCEGLGIDLETVFQQLEQFSGVPGRMERIDGAIGYDVFVDYAHTDDALDKALSMLREITRGKLIVAFGCGGNRDREKRKSMMEVAQRHANFVCATSDNPRGESVEAILSDMKQGVTKPNEVEFISDRRSAINRVLDFAQPGDTVLIAGKGHETMQEFKDRIVPFDDRVVTRELLEMKQLVKQRDK
jgi:UDP-N-acetylmuramoyl-L-alanyl-D-glutamate--2,6-diaminopimelate ligase